MLNAVKQKAAAKGLSSAMSVLGEMTKDIVPSNDVAHFVEENIELLFECEHDDGSVPAQLLVKVMIDEANANPDFVLYKFLNFYNAFREFYIKREQEKERQEKKEVQENDIRKI